MDYTAAPIYSLCGFMVASITSALEHTITSTNAASGSRLLKAEHQRQDDPQCTCSVHGPFRLDKLAAAAIMIQKALGLLYTCYDIPPGISRAWQG
jgi:hypothetical protein